MAYFLVVPAFLAWLAFSAAVLILLRVKAPNWPGRPYVFHGSLGASAGALIANALLVAALALGANLMPESAQAQGSVQDLSRIVWGLAALLGPFAATAVGWLLGLLVGLVAAHSRGRRAAS